MSSAGTKKKRRRPARQQSQQYQIGEDEHAAHKTFQQDQFSEDQQKSQRGQFGEAQQYRYEPFDPREVALPPGLELYEHMRRKSTVSHQKPYHLLTHYPATPAGPERTTTLSIRKACGGSTSVFETITTYIRTHDNAPELTGFSVNGKSITLLQTLLFAKTFGIRRQE
jgi:hypothetical protein